MFIKKSFRSKIVRSCLAKNCEKLLIKIFDGIHAKKIERKSMPTNQHFSGWNTYLKICRYFRITTKIRKIRVIFPREKKCINLKKNLSRRWIINRREEFRWLFAQLNSFRSLAFPFLQQVRCRQFRINYMNQQDATRSTYSYCSRKIYQFPFTPPVGLSRRVYNNSSSYRHIYTRHDLLIRKTRFSKQTRYNN